MAGAATAAVAEFGKGEPEKIVVDTEGASLIVRDAGTKALLVTIMEKKEGVAKVVQAMNDISPEVKELVR
jgi:predicted regulator of Ras-like GTPase activity (Roadblock/LC7/MglB family)